MQITKNILNSILSIAFVLALIILSLRNGSIFLEQILMCSFIITVVLLARLQSGKKITQEKEQTQQ